MSLARCTNSDKHLITRWRRNISCYMPQVCLLRVLTVNNPQLAASNMAMHDASIKDCPVSLLFWRNQSSS
jgi:hypothetical protein